MCRLVQSTIYIHTAGVLTCGGTRIDCFPLAASTFEMSMQFQLPACKFSMERWSHSCWVSTDENFSSCSAPLALPWLFPWAGVASHKGFLLVTPWQTLRGLQGHCFLTATLGPKLQPLLAGSNALGSFIQNQTLSDICIFHPYKKLCFLEHSCTSQGLCSRRCPSHPAQLKGRG